MNGPYRRFLADTSIGIFLVVTTIVAVIFSLVALGFSEWPSEPGQRDLARTLFATSYRIGIPALLISQLVAVVMGARGHRRAALIIPILSLSAFCLCVAMVLALLNRAAA
jgi:hypothetical protein